MDAAKILGCLALIALANLAPVGGAAQDSDLGLHYCAPPIIPKCADAADTFRSASHVASCRQEITRYVKFVLSYRDCLIRESDRAVLQANVILVHFKCSIEADRNC